MEPQPEKPRTPLEVLEAQLAHHERKAEQTKELIELYKVHPEVRRRRAFELRRLTNTKEWGQ